MGNEKDIFEWRRFGHWNSSARKARFSAFVLWSLRNEPLIDELADKCEHPKGDHNLAIIEAFVRESAIALELVIKAVIAHNLQTKGADPAIEGVPTTHDIPRLWKDAGLPELPKDDVYRLHLAKSTLMWSGRYATPRTIKAWEEENKAFEALEPKSEKISFRKPITMGWVEFNHLYKIAESFL